MTMGQAWLSSPHPDFRPATVHVWKDEEHLCVNAILEDVDIFNPVNEFNALAFTKGDAFEMFIRPVGQDAYFEFHVTPDNQLLQLCIPSGDLFYKNRGQPIPRAWFIDDWRITSSVRLEPEANRWHVHAQLPVEHLLINNRDDSRWLVSFSRYDYTRGKSHPVHSSTSPHAKLDFHRQEEWALVTF